MDKEKKKMTSLSEIPDIFKNESFGSDEEAQALATQADTVIQNLTKTYLESTQIGIDELNHLLSDAHHLNDSDRTALIKGVFFRTAHDLKGQGSTFGYPLITDLGAHICAKIRSKENFSSDDLDILQLDIDDMQKILKITPESEHSLSDRISARLKKG